MTIIKFIKNIFSNKNKIGAESEEKAFAEIIQAIWDRDLNYRGYWVIKIYLSM